MKAGAMPGAGAVCHGHHVWDEDECLRCGLIDPAYFADPLGADGFPGIAHEPNEP